MSSFWMSFAAKWLRWATSPCKSHIQDIQARVVHWLERLWKYLTLRWNDFEDIVPWVKGLWNNQCAEEVGWDSSRPGYDGLIDVAKRLLLHYPSRQETEQATARVLRSLFPSWLLTLFKKLIAPLGDGKLGAVLCGNFSLFVTLFLHFLCQDCPWKWLFLQMTEISFRKT